MPQFIIGNLWDSTADIIAVTTNSTLRADGALVMGRGAAKEAAERWPELPKRAGKHIAELCGSGGFYGWVVVGKGPTHLGLFQVKYHWRDAARLDLIERSVSELCDFLEIFPFTVALNYPGVGNGRLAESAVAPLLARLPERVTIYRREG